MSARYDHEVTTLAHALRRAAQKFQHVLDDRDDPEGINNFTQDDEDRALDEKLAAEEALYAAIDKAGGG